MNKRYINFYCNLSLLFFCNINNNNNNNNNKLYFKRVTQLVFTNLT